MMVRVISRIEEMMVQCPVKPVVEELHRPHMQQSHEQCSICPPNWKVGCSRNVEITQIEQYPIEDDLIVPVVFLFMSSR